MKKRLLPILLLLCFLLMAGCVKTKIIEDVLLVQAIGFDKVNSHTMEETLSYSKYGGPPSSGGPQAGPQPQFIQKQERRSKGFNQKSIPRPLNLSNWDSCVL